MPLYPYRCTVCGHRFEKIQRFSAEPEKTCPKCGGTLERPLTAPGLKFKGAGWYVNDYAAKGKAPAEEPPAEKQAGTEIKTKVASGGSNGATNPTASTSSATPSAATN